MERCCCHEKETEERKSQRFYYTRIFGKLYSAMRSLPMRPTEYRPFFSQDPEATRSSNLVLLQVRRLIGIRKGRLEIYWEPV
jgi:hypothetical protein